MSIMHRSLLLALVAWLGGCATPRPTVRVATDAVFPPFHYVDEEGRLRGYDLDVARLALFRAGYDAQFVRVVSYAALFEGLGSSDHDVVAATTGITPARQLKYAFTRPYFVTCLGVLVLDGPGAPRSLDDLADKVIAASAGTTSVAAAASVGAGSVVEVPSASDGLEALRNGHADAYVVDEFEAVEFARGARDLRVLAQPAALERYGLVLRPSQAELARALDAALISMERDGTLAELRDRHGLDRPGDWPIELPGDEGG